MQKSSDERHCAWLSCGNFSLPQWMLMLFVQQMGVSLFSWSGMLLQPLRWTIVINFLKLPEASAAIACITAEQLAYQVTSVNINTEDCFLCSSEDLKDLDDPTI